MDSFVVMRAATDRSQATAEGSQLRVLQQTHRCLVMLCAAKPEMPFLRKLA